MTLRFSDRGPEFPSALVDALIAGDVVFLCGSGISAPQLPDFKRLVDQTYERLGIEMDASEKHSYDNLRFEEVLGALQRRLADQTAMVRTVSSQLVLPSHPRFEQHRTVLRLSRDRSNRVLVVTTNFDTLLEHALEQSVSVIGQQSFAGQSLPSPGSPDFSGIIHIHGRLADLQLDLEATPLVLTSADYGDAYMRSGWASRFLFDLARCKTIVLLGYSATDAPVRYFLNVLEADRARFPDLRPVYAFDAYEANPVDAEKGWGTLAVTPLPYCKRNSITNSPDHSPLWRDLQHLADIIEHPKRSREERLKKILVGDSSALTDQQLRELSWLFTDCSDLWPIAVDTINDANWFRVFQNNELWSAQDASMVVSAWIGRNFEDPRRITTALEWQLILGNNLFSRLDQLLFQTPPESPTWLRIWRILLGSDWIGDFDETAQLLSQKLASGLILEKDLRQSVELLAPRLIAERPWQFGNKGWGENKGVVDAVAVAPRLSDLAKLDLRVVNEYGATEIIKALSRVDSHVVRILELSSEALHSLLHQAAELEMIDDDYDTSDYNVPSIEDHDQNEYNNGLILLVRAIVNAFPKAIISDRDRARALAVQWQTWPGRLGARLLLHVVRNTSAFSADEALQLLLSFEDIKFWEIRREVALLLRDRAAGATPALREAIETRILTTGSAFYTRYPLEDGQVDWRLPARDSEVWLRLKMLDAADVLSEVGRIELEAIIERRQYLDRTVADQDFFTSYIGNVQAVPDNSSPIFEAAPDDRLMVATQLDQRSELDQRMGWRSYCHSNPKGAFEALETAEPTAPNITMWGDLLGALTVRPTEKDALLRDQLAADALLHLEKIEMQTLQPITGKIVDLLMFGPRPLIANLENWCDRLWSLLLLVDYEIDFQKDIYEAAINRSEGRLVHVLLTELDHTRKSEGKHEARQLARLAMIAGNNSQSGIMGQAVLIHEFAFMINADKMLVEKHLVPRLTASTVEAPKLREILVSRGNITPEVTTMAPQALLLGVAEASADTRFAIQIASSILRPALALVRGDSPERWGLSETEISRVLRIAPLKIRVGVLGVLARWIRNDASGAEDAWKQMVEPFFERIWPKERCFVDDALNRDFTSLVIGAGKSFPAALIKLRPYFSLGAHRGANLHSIKNSSTPEKFPFQVLELLWLICGNTGSNSYDMGGILDRLVAADPNIEIDRRFQSLEQRTNRYR